MSLVSRGPRSHGSPCTVRLSTAGAWLREAEGLPPHTEKVTRPEGRDQSGGAQAPEAKGEFFRRPPGSSALLSSFPFQPSSVWHPRGHYSGWWEQGQVPGLGCPPPQSLSGQGTREGQSQMWDTRGHPVERH